MQYYNLRTTSLSNTQLTEELSKRGAQTFGSVKRKQERLKRFIDAASKKNDAHQNMRIVIENEQRQVVARGEARVSELRRSPRLSSLLGHYLGW